MCVTMVTPINRGLKGISCRPTSRAGRCVTMVTPINRGLKVHNKTVRSIRDLVTMVTPINRGLKVYRRTPQDVHSACYNGYPDQ